MVRKQKAHFIPAAATVANLAAGLWAIFLASSGRYDQAALLIIAAVLFDSLDGALARMFRATSEFGAELDSLADVVSFGVAPAVVVACLMPEELRLFGWFMALFYGLCCAWRLARFNANRATSSHGFFLGLPSTAAGGCAASMVLAHNILAESGHMHGIGLLPWVLLVLSVLMVSHFHYRHIGILMAKFPVAWAVGGLFALAMVVLYWRYELAFAVFFWGYAATGPVLAVGEKLKELHEARI